MLGGLHGDAETHNVAAERPEILKEMLELYSQYAASAVIPLTFRYGFADPESGERSRVLQQVSTGKARTINCEIGRTAAREQITCYLSQTSSRWQARRGAETLRHNMTCTHAGNSLPRASSPYGSPEPHCQGQFGHSPYCSYGHEFDCMVTGRRIAHGGGGGGGSQTPIGQAAVAAAVNGSTCHAACSEHKGCTWWSLEPAAADGDGDGEGGGHGGAEGLTCLFFSAKPTEFVDCAPTPDATAAPQCAYGPEDCGYGAPADGNPFPGPVQPPPPPPPAACKTNSTSCVVEGEGLQVGAEHSFPREQRNAWLTYKCSSVVLT